MIYRDFPPADAATETNLRSLERLADQDGGAGTFEEIDSLLVRSIETLERLPPGLLAYFSLASFKVSGRHERGPATVRRALWQKLAAELAEGLDSVASDAALHAGTDTGERAATRGERITAACEAIDQALRERGDLDSAIAALERVASGTSAGGDARELRRLLSLKRVPDVDAWRTEIHRLVQHAEDLAGHLHHLP